MKSLSTIITIIAGIVVAPFLVYIIDRFLNGGPNWLPYFLALLAATVIALLAPVRYAAIALVIGVLAFGVVEQYKPSMLTFLPREVRFVDAPF
jgi:hypothetical protein